MSQKHFFAGFVSGLADELEKEAGKGSKALSFLREGRRRTSDVGRALRSSRRAVRKAGKWTGTEKAIVGAGTVGAGAYGYQLSKKERDRRAKAKGKKS